MVAEGSVGDEPVAEVPPMPAREDDSAAAAAAAAAAALIDDGP